MPLWILFTLMAAFMQAIRTACQKTLAERSSTAGATLARSLFALPLAWGYLYLVWQLNPPQAPLQFSISFGLYAVFASIAQIIATLLMVHLFKQRNYAIGICYAKTEAIMVAVFGALLFSESLNLSGWLGVLIGAGGILLLSPKPEGSRGLKGLLSATAALGLASGTGFALTSLSIRQAGIGLGDQLILNAAITLVTVISLQSLCLGGYMLINNRDQIISLMRHWKLASWVGLTSVAGSIGWFTAMTLVNPALVKTLGQIEFLFVLLLSHRLFKERQSRRELTGMFLILLSVICVLQA